MPLICCQPPPEGRNSQTPWPGNSPATSPRTLVARWEALAPVTWVQAPVARSYCQTPWPPNSPTTVETVAFSSTDTDLGPATLTSPWLTTARSGLPSPLKSPTAAAQGARPTAKVCWSVKEALVEPAAVAFSSTDTRAFAQS